MSADQTEPPLFDATLRPSPPLGPRSLRLVLIVVASMNLAFALFFVLRGAWPIMPFMGADVVLLALAFRASVRAAQRSERVVVTPTRLLVERHPVGAPATTVAFNPYWVRVDMQEPPDHWSQVTLWSHGRGVRVGAFLPPAQRVSLAKDIKSALRRARETPQT